MADHFVKIAEIVSPDVVVMNVPQYGNQIWQKSKLRKRTDCCDCRNDIQTENAFRPLTNASNRGNRLCLYCFQFLVDQFQKGVI